MKIVSVSIACLFASQLFAYDKIITQEEYVSMWAPVAVQQMSLYKIPASITLAQGILESGNGNSELARSGNNHFGIKCHEWTGEKMYIDDDQKGECFRVYSSADESFRDHSLFLTGRTRYSKLFEYESDDYESWAKGLKEAGYATDPKYPQRLIDIIERLNLSEYDEPGLELAPKKDLVADAKKTKSADTKKETEHKTTASKETKNASAAAMKVSGYQSHAVKEHKNKINYVVARKGDTFYKIAQEFDLGMWQLYRYNDYGPKKDLLEEGDIVYIQPKRNRSKTKGDVFLAQRSMSVAQISQQEGIKVESLLNMNNLSSPDEIVPKGQRVILR